MPPGTAPARWERFSMSDRGHSSRPASGTTPRVGRLLIVDDESRLADAVRRLLSDEFEVTVTSLPIEALKWLLCGDWYDVILCDVMMPVMNGVQLHDRVHAVHPELAARFVFVTGGVSVDSVRQLLDSVPNLVLERPIDFGALREFIRRRVISKPPPRRSASQAPKAPSENQG
jgi:DNA-binding NtrC family response regulator